MKRRQVVCDCLLLTFADKRTRVLKVGQSVEVVVHVSGHGIGIPHQVFPGFQVVEVVSSFSIVGLEPLLCGLEKMSEPEWRLLSPRK